MLADRFVCFLSIAVEVPLCLAYLERREYDKFSPKVTLGSLLPLPVGQGKVFGVIEREE